MRKHCTLSSQIWVSWFWEKKYLCGTSENGKVYFALMSQSTTLSRLICCLLLGIASALPAQENTFSELAIGLRQGYQFSRINFSPVPPQGLNEGFTSGLVLQYLSQKQLGFQMEINYSQRGWNAHDFLATPIYSREMDYIEVPFLTHFAIGKKSFRLVLNAGSYLSYLIKDQASFASQNNIEVGYYREPINNKWTYGLIGGFGFALRSKIGVFQIEGRGALGFTDIFAVENAFFDASPEQFFGGQISYLYRFGQRKKEITPEEIIPEEKTTDEDETSDL